MRQYDLEKSQPEGKEANNGVSSYLGWNRAKEAKRSPAPLLFVRATPQTSQRWLKFGAALAIIGLVLLAWLLVGPGVFHSPGSSPATMPSGPQLGVLYISSKARIASGAPASADGLIITEVKRGSPADLAGLHAGDLIVKIEGRVVRADDSLLSLLSPYHPGDSLKLEVLRNGHSLQFSLRLA